MNTAYDTSIPHAHVTDVEVLPPPTAPPSYAHRPGIGSPQESSYRLPAPSGSHTMEIQQKQKNRLTDQGYTSGLANSLSDMKLLFPLRIWIVDNSGSMQSRDGNRFVETTSSQNVKIVPCTRWAEIQECVTYHIQMSALLQAPTSFRLLNHPGAHVGKQQFDLALDGEENIPQETADACRIITNARPSGVTPLTNHIIEIQKAVCLMKEDLIQRGQRVSLIIATDGLPTDDRGQGGRHVHDMFIEALRSLEGLPMWIVIRLCTDEDDVVDFYSSLDDQLELSIEVLDDFVSEAKEVHKHNEWLNYALPLHRMREMGFHDRVFDMLDERDLTQEELHQFCMFLFGVENMDGMPDPAADWSGFLRRISELNEREAPQWDPLRKRVLPWIDTKKLNKRYGESRCCIM